MMQRGKKNGQKPNMKAECSHAPGAGQCKKPTKSSSKYVPDEEGRQPLPAWKRMDDLQPILPEADKGRAETEGGTITAQEYMERVRRGEP